MLNDLSGTIPTELGLLTNLDSIILCKCGRKVDLCLDESVLIQLCFLFTSS